MHFIDMNEPERIRQRPDKTSVLLESGSFVQDGFMLSRIELRLYLEKTDDVFGPYSLITLFVDTDKGSIEMIYDEGFRGNDALLNSADFVTSNLGLSALILRAIIALKNCIAQSNSN